MKAIAVAFVVLALVGCSTQPRFASEPVDVREGQLHFFWIPDRSDRNLEVPAKAARDKVPGRVLVAYLIDSDGKVVDPQVMSARPPGLYNEAALNLIRTQRFRPAPSNTNRIPVRVRTEITFNLDEGG